MIDFLFPTAAAYIQDSAFLRQHFHLCLSGEPHAEYGQEVLFHFPLLNLLEIQASKLLT